MKRILKTLIPLFISFLFSVQPVTAQTATLRVETWIPEDLQRNAGHEGRLFLFLAPPSGREPRLNIWPGTKTKIYAINRGNRGEKFTFSPAEELSRSGWPLDEIPQGSYRIQVLLHQNPETCRIDAPGNLYSATEYIDLSDDLLVRLPLEKIIPPEKLADHPLLKKVEIESKILSEWWNREVHLKAAVLLPAGFYDEPGRKYPVRYTIAGYGGRYTRANRFVEWDHDFLAWWQSDKAPQIISVFLDGYGPYGDSYQLDSENSGPYGTALINELIPAIEKKFRAQGTPASRFLDGCSTGGWVSLALQLFYPDFFGGCYSYSADPVDFENFQLIDIYHDDNAFYNEHEYLRPLMRDITGEPILSHETFVHFENVLGRTDSYVTSGGQFGAFNALYSPRGKDGLPRPVFDPLTGKIDHDVALHWQKYDLKQYVESNWKTLGSKIKGKIWIWMGDMDNFYLNPAMREFSEMLKTRKHPASDATILFAPMKGHCSGYSHKKVLEQIAEKLKE